ncbi:hypothetical protein P4U97_06515 [Bacillus swezeyi]|uniref:hypothetical protein n=1 Tax=Bacillus swezeyi TaxID=1925020 RepID=UPI002E228D4E|nr:hypothetical protein [Bacillus swezeyi]
MNEKKLLREKEMEIHTVDEAELNEMVGANQYTPDAIFHSITFCITFEKGPSCWPKTFMC